MTIASIKEEVVNTNNNELNEVKAHEKNDQNKLSICVVLFSMFHCSEFFLSLKMKISSENCF